MTELKKYQYATIVLAIAVVGLFGLLLMEKKDDNISDLVSQINTQLTGCKERMEEWSQKNSGSEISAEAKSELEDIVSACQKEVEDAQKKVSEE